jgi:D-glycero-alpha-D-manno-heptose-7-phosphate kinase
MLGIRAPFRISYIGGGTDLPAFYRRQPGAVISAAIDKYMYIFVHRFFYPKIQVKYSKTEIVDSVDQLKHPIVREVLKRFEIPLGMDINSIADVPAGTGLGSSSAFTVALLHALRQYHGVLVSKSQLAQEACEIEINRLGEPIGKQDQYASAFGALNKFTFQPDEQVNVDCVPLYSPATCALEDATMLFYLGRSRTSKSILKKQKKNTEESEKTFQLLQHLVLHVGDFQAALHKCDIAECGRLVHESWMLKKQLSDEVSNVEVDYYYQIARKAGIWGGKLAGAGGTGFLLLLCDPERQAHVRKALALRELPIRFDRTGSAVITMRMAV